jgi:hypothetical protein
MHDYSACVKDSRVPVRELANLHQKKQKMKMAKLRNVADSMHNCLLNVFDNLKFGVF